LLRWSLVTVAGGVAGSALLVFTSSAVFNDVVPYLLVIAALGLLLQPRLSSWQQRHPSQGNRLLLPCGLFAVSTYNGYFGAGAGVMLLALLMVTVDQHIARANALKNVLVGVSTVVSASLFVALGRVEWNAAIPLAAGMFFGSTIGPRIARRLPGNVLRLLVALTGLGLAARLWIAPL
jgi:hypothetical protein